MRKIFGIIIMSLIIAGCTQEIKPQEEPQPVPSNMPAVKPQEEIQPGPSNIPAERNPTAIFTLKEVAAHSIEGDCWLAIEGKVYDVSDFASHPGGPAILEGCGTDATDLFLTRPMGSGTPHSSRARDLLETYYIGELK